jgi:hypothetical protein
MFHASTGDGAAAPSRYRHPLLHAMSSLMAPLFSSPRSRQGGWTALTLALTALLMAHNEAPTLRARFDHARALLSLRRGRTYQGFVKALHQRGAELVVVLRRHLAQLLWTLRPEHLLIQGWCVFAVDGSRFDAPRTAANLKGLGVPSRTGSGPQMLAVILVHLGLGVLWDWRVGRGDGSERGRFRAMVSGVPAGALLVGDAGFIGFDCLRSVVAGGRHFLVRLAGNAQLVRGLTADPGVVAVWPKHRQKDPPLLMRMIRVADGKGGHVVLGTSVFDAGRLSDEQAAVFYRLRWGVEVCYRSLKQTLERRKMRSASPAKAKLELHWTLMGMMILGVLTLQRLNPLLSPARWSVAAAVQAVRSAARGRMQRHVRRGLAALRGAVTPNTARRSKKAPAWPHKKTEKPPGPPHLRAASDAELRRFKDFTLQVA